MEIGSVSGVIPVLLGLFLFGIGYNVLVSWLIHHGYDEGYMWAIVAGGVAITLAGVAIIAPMAALLALLAFTASGLPMAVGAWWRHVRSRKAAQERVRSEVLE
jgi:hypothetical protein